MEHRSALALASTVRHDGSGGVADDLATVAGAAEWVRGHVGAGVEVDEELRGRLVGLRGAVRALFARAVRPGPPSPADAERLLPVGRALERLNTDAALVPVRPELSWPEDGPAVELVADRADPGNRIVAALARAAVAFLAGPERERLRSCTAPRCVRYFVQEHGRQRWCGTSCGNRARAARHYARHGAPRD
ncbi:CGNR zinc finger domain-containing protein [Nocardiopsis nanhaiensis]